MIRKLSNSTDEELAFGDSVMGFMSGENHDIVLLMFRKVEQRCIIVQLARISRRFGMFS